MKITPSARVLRMLGEIEFAEWQCVSELVDNSFDDFGEIVRSGEEWHDGYKVIVSLPSSPSGELKIVDTGRGMTLERLEHAVRAGWSGNDMHDKLGLFGMGFNVATARLGKRTRVLTTRSGDSEWIGVEIDLDRIKDDFEAIDITEPKSDPAEHGTRIIIDRLNHTRAEWLRRNGSALRNKLGSVYSWILDERGFELHINGARVKPVRHCRWGDDRHVIYNGKEPIPAYIEIDEKLQDGRACSECGRWQLTHMDICAECGSENVTVRARHIRGWLGIQRYLHKTEYGIDFLRNGRKILRWDKRLFTWNNPDGIPGNEDPEYPIDLAHQGGRIIGEIHLDHVPVTYAKDAFEYGDRSWRTAVEILRGVAPLKSQRAQDLGYPENTSPLARLFKGYRRNDAGQRCLVPGDGHHPIHDETRRWGQEFQKGNPEFQTDERWWRAVLEHEEKKNRGKEAKTKASVPNQPDERAVLNALGIPGDAPASDTRSPKTNARDGDDNTTSSTVVTKPKTETRSERLARYEKNSTPHSYLSRSFGHPDLGYLKVETRLLTDGELLGDSGQAVPVLLDQRSGNEFMAFVDSGHDVFQRFGADYADLLLVELAPLIKVRARSEWSPSQLLSGIRAQSLKESALDGTTVGAEAKDLLNEIRSRTSTRLNRSGEFRAVFDNLTEEEKTAAEKEMIASDRVARFGQDAEFVSHLPPLSLVRLVETMPETFLDGHVFRRPYAGLGSPSARSLSLAFVTGYLSDVATISTFTGQATALQLQRARLSITLLADELAGDE